MRATGERPEVLAILEICAAAPIGGIVRRTELEKVAATRQWAIFRVVGELAASRGIFLEPVRGIGYRRLGASDGIVMMERRGRLRTRNAARRNARRLRSGLPHVNDPDARRRAIQGIANAELIAHLTLDKTALLSSAANGEEPSAWPQQWPPSSPALDQLRAARGL